MLLKTLLLYILSTSFINCSVLLWSNKNLEVPSLTDFSDRDLDDIVDKLDNPEVTIYKSSSLIPEIENLLSGYYTAYNPNGKISTENATELNGVEDLTILENKQQLDLSRDGDVLSVLYIPHERFRREIEAGGDKSALLYKGTSTKDTFFSLLYSSQPLQLRTHNSTVELGESLLVTIDQQSKNASSRLDVTVSVGEEKYILQFSFTWKKSYWSMSTVKVKSTLINSSMNLFITEPFSVPKHFSYHCSGATVFADTEKTVTLTIFDLQVQPDSKDGIFGDVYDCVDFTTVPIWSGIFVTAIMGVALTIALVAINEIKTMDKFDSQKMKQLVFTVVE